jgi:hypothetical protein
MKRKAEIKVSHYHHVFLFAFYKRKFGLSVTRFQRRKRHDSEDVAYENISTSVVGISFTFVVDPKGINNLNRNYFH